MRSPIRFAKRVRQRRQFRSIGTNVRFDPDGWYTHEHITLGSNVDLGLRPILLATRSLIQVGNNVMFGPEVTIRGGNHRTDLVGRPMFSIAESEKREQDDQGVRVEDDVWVGTRAIILHGVVLGRGCVVGAGSVVTKSIPRYAIAAGNPARIIAWRFTAQEIIRHEAALYPRAERSQQSDLSPELGPLPATGQS